MARNMMLGVGVIMEHTRNNKTLSHTNTTVSYQLEVNRSIHGALVCCYFTKLCINARKFKGESGLFFTPVLTLWIGCHIASHMWS